jgi:alpha-glucoside transport system substrate-binding protein
LEAGGVDIDRCAKCTPIDKLVLRLLHGPQTVFRLDGSDMMPAGFGTNEFWAQATKWINGQCTRQTVDAMEAAWPD